MQDALAALGIKLSVAAAGLMGGLVRALSRRSPRWQEILISPIVGALTAAYLTGTVAHYLGATGFPLPDGAEATHAIAFALGACGMWVSDALIEGARRRFGTKARE